MFNATATPTPIFGVLAPPLPTALPLELAVASVSFDAERLNSPAELIVNPSAREALAVELTTFKAIPAATDTLP